MENLNQRAFVLKRMLQCSNTKEEAYKASSFYQKRTDVKNTASIMKKGGIIFMITLCLIILILAILAIILLALAGIVAVAWPVLIVLAIGLLIDILVLKLLFGKKGGK